MKKCILEKKLAKAKKQTKHILKHYHSKKALKKIHAVYEKERRKKKKNEINDQLKKGNAYYLKVQKLTKRIETMSLQLANIISDKESAERELSSNSDVQDSIFSNRSPSDESIRSQNSQTNNIREQLAECLDEEVVEDDEHACLECANCKQCQNMLLIE